jgi:hypothetical protein
LKKSNKTAPSVAVFNPRITGRFYPRTDTWQTPLPTTTAGDFERLDTIVVTKMKSRFNFDPATTLS